MLFFSNGKTIRSFFVFLDKDVPFSKGRSLYFKETGGVEYRKTTIGRFNHNPTEIRPFEDIPTENRPIGRYI